MAKKIKVVLNRKAWGQNIMAGSAVTSAVEQAGQHVAAALPGDTQVEVIVTSAASGGSRVRARVSHGTSSRHEADSNELISALSSVLPLARS